MVLEEIRLFYLGNALGWKRSGNAQSAFSCKYEEMTDRDHSGFQTFSSSVLIETKTELYCIVLLLFGNILVCSLIVALYVRSFCTLL